MHQSNRVKPSTSIEKTRFFMSRPVKSSSSEQDLFSLSLSLFQKKVSQRSWCKTFFFFKSPNDENSLKCPLKSNFQPTSGLSTSIILKENDITWLHHFDG